MSAIGADSYLHTFSCPEKPLTSMRFFSSPQHMPQNWNATAVRTHEKSAIFTVDWYYVLTCLMSLSYLLIASP
jgi:hypothetical protein